MPSLMDVYGTGLTRTREDDEFGWRKKNTIFGSTTQHASFFVATTKQTTALY